MNSRVGLQVPWVDQWGEQRTIHFTRNGARVKQSEDTANHLIQRTVSAIIGQRVRDYRKAKGMSPDELAMKAGLSFGGTPKQRIFEIEKNKRNLGVKFGTLFQLAIALEIPVSALLPTKEEVLEILKGKLETTPFIFIPFKREAP